jgi:hypothetical protein
METVEKNRKKVKEELPVLSDAAVNCSFEGYDALLLMSETAKLRKLITKRGTLEILIPLCCTTNPVRHKQFRQALRDLAQEHCPTDLKN